MGYSYLNRLQQGKDITPNSDLLPAASPRKSLSSWFANEKPVHNLSGFANIVSISELLLASRVIKNLYWTYMKIQYSYVPVY